jgi:hypothetical protein
MTDSSVGRHATLLAGTSRALWRLLVSFLFSWISYTASVALIGWLVFERTRSPAVVSIAFALRFVPLAFTGVLAGVLSGSLVAASPWVSARLPRGTQHKTT